MLNGRAFGPRGDGLALCLEAGDWLTLASSAAYTGRTGSPLELTAKGRAVALAIHAATQRRDYWRPTLRDLATLAGVSHELARWWAGHLESAGLLAIDDRNAPCRGRPELRPLTFQLQIPESATIPVHLVRLARVYSLVRQLGMSAYQARDWVRLGLGRFSDLLRFIDQRLRRVVRLTGDLLTRVGGLRNISEIIQGSFADLVGAAPAVAARFPFDKGGESQRGLTPSVGSPQGHAVENPRGDHGEGAGTGRRIDPECAPRSSDPNPHRGNTLSERGSRR